MNSIMVWTPSDIAGLVIVGAIIGAALINAVVDAIFGKRK